MKGNFKMKQNLIKLNVKLKNKHIRNLKQFGNYGVSGLAVENYRKQYLSSKALGVNFSGFNSASLINSYRSDLRAVKQIYSISKIIAELKKPKFKSKTSFRCNLLAIIKTIRLLKSCNVTNETIYRCLTWSDNTIRCLQRLRDVKKDVIAKNLKGKESTTSDFAIKIKKFKDQYKANTVRHPTETPNESKSFIGLEVELISPYSESSFKKEAERLKIKNFTIGSDGSIEVDTDENPDDQGHEVRMLIENSEENLKKQLKKLCTVLSNMESYVNTSCGLHIHLDMRHKSDTEIYEIGLRFKRCLSVLSTLVPQSRRDNDYCKLQKSDTDRYSAINMTALRKYNTIEIRLHSGTVDYLKIYNWIRLLNLIKETKNDKTFKTLDEMIEGLSIPDELALFYYNRYKKFNANIWNEETSLSESSILTIDQISFTENNSQAVTA